MFGNPRAPEKVLEDVDTYLSDANVPNYVAIQTLKKAIKAHPDNAQLKERLEEIEKSQNINVSQSSPKTLYGILVIAIGAMGLGFIISAIYNNANWLGLVFGVSYIIGAIIIYKQYKKEK